MASKTVSLEELALYSDQYIALTQDRVKIIASGKTIKELEGKLKKMNVKNVIIHYVSPIDAYLSPVCH